MKQDTTINRPPGVAEMARVYDPAYSYVVIEHRLGGEQKAGFLKVDEALSSLKTEIVGQELVEDPSTGAKRLVIKMKLRETEEIMLAFLGTNLKDKFRCYIY